MAVTNTKGGVKCHQIPSLKHVFHSTVSAQRAQEYLYNASTASLFCFV